MKTHISSTEMIQLWRVRRSIYIPWVKSEWCQQDGHLWARWCWELECRWPYTVGSLHCVEPLSVQKDRWNGSMEELKKGQDSHNWSDRAQLDCSYVFHMNQYCVNFNTTSCREIWLYWKWMWCAIAHIPFDSNDQNTSIQITMQISLSSHSVLPWTATLKSLSCCPASFVATHWNSAVSETWAREMTRLAKILTPSPCFTGSLSFSHL